MHCPICNVTDTKVIDSRLLLEGMSVRRRRKCESCESRFTTYEKVQLQMPMVSKHDGRRENYEREKIVRGLKKACQKRPVSTNQINDLIESVEKTILSKYQNEIPSNELGELVMKTLYKIDKVSFVRFASFYWDFDDIKEFINGLQSNVKSFSGTVQQENQQQ